MLAISALLCLVVAVLTLAWQRPVNGLDFLTVPGIVLFVLGAAFATLTARDRRHRRRYGLPQIYRPNVAAPLALLVLVGLLLAASAVPFILRGAPDGGDATCRYRLRNHTVVICVTQREYQLAGAAGQRFVTGIWLAMFSDFTRVAINEARPRRRSAQNSTVEIR